ncbi:MAG: BlaI/MecI/CopY family transcriptional regulator [Hominenteromicrobium sp.]
MKSKKVHVRLTNSELAMMQLLWEAGRPLNRAEIMEIALRDPDNPLFAKNSFHVIINNLMAYQFIAAFMNNGAGRKNARRFAPMITRNEYFAQQIATTDHYKASDIPEIVAALFKYTKGADKDELLEKIEIAVRRNTK